MTDSGSDRTPAEEAVRRRGQVIAATRLAWVAAAVFVVANLAVQTVLGLQQQQQLAQDEERIEQNEAIQQFILNQARENAQIGRDARDAARRIVDCTTPGGDCYQEGQRRTTEAVVGINEGTLRVIVAALTCQAEGVTGQRPLAMCTAERAAAG